MASLSYISVLLPSYVVYLCLFGRSHGHGLIEEFIKSEVKKQVDMLKASMESQVEEKVKKRFKEEVEKELEAIREGKCLYSLSCQLAQLC